MTDGVIREYVDPWYGGRIRHLDKPDGHEHNLYHYRNPWNADHSLLAGVWSDLQQRNWRVVLYDGDGAFLKELFPIGEYDWRLVWDRHDPQLLYTWRPGALYCFDVTTGGVELLKSFAPLRLGPAGPSLNQAGDRILVVTADGTLHSFRLSDLGDERAFLVPFPPGYAPSWDKARYIGYRDYVVAAANAGDPGTTQLLICDDAGGLYHRFEGPSTGIGHHDFSPDGRFAYFNYLEMWREHTPLEIHVVNVDGTDDRVVYRIPWAEMRYVQNLHLSWPSQVGEWFVASFFPAADNLPPTYAPPLDEILLISTDGTHRFLARTETAYARANARTGGSQDMFWAQPVASVSGDGSRICFNSNRAGTIDQYLLYTSAPDLDGSSGAGGGASGSRPCIHTRRNGRRRPVRASVSS